MNYSDYELSIDLREHKYTDNYGTIYTSVTTKNAEYEPQFNSKSVAKACEVIGRDPSHPDYEKYKHKSRHQLIKEWDRAAKVGQDRGNERHSFLETSVNKANGYRKFIESKMTDGRIYTILDILADSRVGRVNLGFFAKTGIKERFPVIYELIRRFVKHGYTIYSEVCVFSPKHGIAGLVDILLIKDGKFVIIDWKTNRDDITYESGFWEKNKFGERTGRFMHTKKVMTYPLHDIPYSIGGKYTMQLTAYNYLIEDITDLKWQANILCHIRHETYSDIHKDVIKFPQCKGKEQVDVMPIAYWKDNYELLLEDSDKFLMNSKRITLFTKQEEIV